jgi:hypothetical protein
MKGSHAGASSPWALYASRIAARALGRRGVWQHRDERRFVCATRVLTSSGYAATSASAVTAPPLLANISTGPPPSASMPTWTSSPHLADKPRPSVR